MQANAPIVAINGTAGSDSLLGTEYADAISGLAGDDYLTGDAGDDVLDGGEGNDFLYGGTGNDVLDGGSGNNQLDGGTGSDIYLVKSDGGSSFINNYESAAGDVDTVFFTDTDLQSLHCSYLNGDMVLSWGSGNQLTLYAQAFMPDSALHFRIRPDAAAPGYVDYTPAGFLAQMLVHVDSRDPSPGFSNYAERVQGTEGDNTLYLNGGDDTVSGAGGNDWLDGGSGDDILDGGSGQNALMGGAGNDVFIMRSDGRQDVIYNYDAAPGDIDTVFFTDVDLQSLYCRNEAGNMVLTWGDGNQLTLGSHFGLDENALHFRIRPEPGAAYQDYTPGQFIEQILIHLDDSGNGMSGSSLSEQLQGGAGAETLHMGGGNDKAAGGGDDAIYGDDGNDSLSGEAGNDTLEGGTGNDVLDGGSGSNLLDGGQGDDIYMVHSDGRQDWISANNKGAGDTDTLFLADTALDELQLGVDGGLLLLSWAGGNQVAMDQLWSIPAIDTFTMKLGSGDAGHVSYSFEQLLAHKTIQLGDGGQTALLTAYGERVLGGAGDDTLLLLDGDNWADGGAGADNISSGTGADELAGGGGNDNLDGGDGGDTLDGGADDDMLFGRDGNDVLRGGSGADIFWLGNGDDTVLVRAGDGYDQLYGDGGGDDTVVFEFLLRSQVTASRNGDGLYLAYGDGDEIYITAQFDPADPAAAVEYFQFADGRYTAAELLGV